MKTESTLQVLDLKKIKITNTNPRKTFDENSLKELSESIKGKGVLQPILVRPYGKAYKLVCGERRYRAATMAGLETIPANIRELTDDEAFEMQIVENLERKDVHPMEEAEAFKRMLDSGKYEVADIAAKMAKPESFIVQRLKLTDLIDEIKQDFFDGKLGIGHAIHIARLGIKDQKEILEWSKNHWGTDGYGTVNELKEQIEGEVLNLEEAVFNTEDPELTKAGACSVCPKRSGANPLLFSDIEGNDKCFDSRCFNNKLDAHLEKRVSEIIRNGENIVFGLEWGENAPEMIKSICDEYKVTILTDNDYSRIWNEEEAKKATQMLVVGGRNAGTIKGIRLTSSKAKEAATGEESSIQHQIEKIEVRSERALELDDEKVWNAVRSGGDSDAGIVLNLESFTSKTEPLNNYERLALIIAISEIAYGISIPEAKELDVQSVAEGVEISDEALNKAFRAFINYKLNSSYGSHTTSKGNAALFHSIKSHFKSYVDSICDHFQSKAEKRITRTNERIEKLKSQLKSEK